MSVDISERLASLAGKIEQQRSSIETEEATKNAFVMPFISLVLGYDVFNPNEVVPEFTADVGTKKGEKIDYAIVKDDEVQILIECKHIGAPLNIKHASQLFRYFAVANARIAVLTNGDEYQFFTDLDAPNRMDEKPFLVVQITDLDAAHVPELRKLTKDVFDLDSIISAAEELKYVGELKRVLAAQFVSPDVEWVKFLTGRVYEGAFTQKVRDQFTALVSKAAKQFLNDRINDRLKAALGGQVVAPDNTTVSSSEASEHVAEASVEAADRKDGIDTTLEEIEAFQIVRAIACSEVAPSRIAQRDNKSYFGILLDDNNRRPIARLWFNTSQKYIGLFDAEKNETREPIETLDEIYKFADRIRETVHYYD
ncbi:type I restriction enzyme HsdR N-terminal domain-containing protein [Leucobacter allii]|uniref:Type I restriction enzyme HsdR N-terminal domain-containing protein n=1 Tax=Leucobacter allii TaxID=2932247 RepID=A0ABY4FL13_9MICO|nr:type I restriction enzyme HsdR N-terminal domain-containing protein [Leucobacter allii]UOQ56962.1 type I restriction enzyme HsdR N-terminal domain-containing protein [Leucobacter allii]